MNTESREELISAYLDGELSDDERARVEKWLTESPQLRQFHDELLALRTGLQSLERHELDHDISGAVLRRAEQSVLRGADSKPRAAAIQPPGTTASWWNRGAGWRRVVWPALAVAAALVILVYDANRPARRELAQAPAGQEEQAAEAQAEAEDQPPVADLRLEVRDAAEEARNRAFKPESGAVEALRREAMPQLKAQLEAAPSSPPPASEPADSPVSVGGLLDAVAKKQAGDGLVLECSPQYLRAGTFEKLLEEKKIKWRRIARQESQDEKLDADRDQAVQREGLYYRAAKDGTLRATYVVDASPKQVNELLGEFANTLRRLDVEKNESQLGVKGRSGNALRELLRPGESSAAGRAGSLTITLVAPEPAPADADAPADKTP